MDSRDVAFRAALLKAFAEGELVIPGLGQSTAHSMRFAIYAFGRKVRRMFEKTGEHGDVVAALDSVALTIEDGALRIYRKDNAAGMQALLTALGEVPGVPEMVVPGAQASQESFAARFGELLPSSTPAEPGAEESPPPVKPFVNPYK